MKHTFATVQRACCAAPIFVQKQMLTAIVLDTFLPTWHTEVVTLLFTLDLQA